MAALTASPPRPRTPQPLFIFIILTLIGIGIGLNLCENSVIGFEFGDLINEYNVLNNVTELECGGALTPIGTNTINECNATGVANNTTFTLANTGGGVCLKNKFGNDGRGAGQLVLD